MITSLEQSRLPKRRDRFNLEQVLTLVLILGMVIFWVYPDRTEPLFEQLIYIFILTTFGLSILIKFYQWYSWGQAWERMAEGTGMNFETYKSKRSLIIPRTESIASGEIRVESVRM